MKQGPKQYECLVCGFISNRSKAIKFPMMTFACCFKCRGKVKERQEWLDWLYAERNKIYAKANP